MDVLLGNLPKSLVLPLGIRIVVLGVMDMVAPCRSRKWSAKLDVVVETMSEPLCGNKVSVFVSVQKKVFRAFLTRF